jgi:hypothetical protein
MLALLLALQLAATPSVVLGDGLQPEPALRREVAAGWRDLETRWTAVGGAPLQSPGTIRIDRGRSLPQQMAGRSRVGAIELRQGVDGVLTGAMVTALRHELAHQFLFAACSAASDDALFHEAFAVATSGELAAWNEGPYLSMNAARRQLRSAPSLDVRSARSALARMLVNLPQASGLPRPLALRLRRCADRAAWVPLSVDDLTAVALTEGDALVVLNRHSGEVLREQGDARVPLPFGSTLKPFVAAGSLAHAPKLHPQPGRDDWFCGEALPDPVDLATALARSCNGYFLDWAAREPEVARLGAYGPLLRALGLAHLPEDGSEAIGLRPTLKLTPLALAQAYRVLAAAQPELLGMLRETPRHGTLAGLPVSPRLEGLALKTGTVRDADARVELGVIVAVDTDVLAVLVRKGRMPRAMAADLVEVLEPFRGQREQVSTEVQVLGLLPTDAVEARCAGLAVVVAPSGPELATHTSSALSLLVKSGQALCLGAPWMVSFPRGPQGGRPYAGSFRFDPPPPYRLPDGAPPISERTRRAREGSSFIFTTRLGLYTAGVLAAEDGPIAGEPRVALALTIAHNAQAPRHPHRPVCDTTHCQAFLGTVAPQAAELAALAQADATPGGWLPFSQGGDEAWTESRPLPRVARALGGVPSALGFSDGEVHATVESTEGDARYDDHLTLPCETLRNTLQLPACPASAQVTGSEVHFSGRGRGHGLGLDVERAKKSSRDARGILQEAYGPGR